MSPIQYVQSERILFETGLLMDEQLGWSLPFAWAGIWTLITFPWVRAELRRERETWGLVQQNHGGEPFTDDITANPRTRMNSFQARILPFTNREKQTSPESSSAIEEPGAVHDNVGNVVADHNTRAAGDEENFVAAVTAEEGTIGAGGLERSASRHDHETTPPTNANHNTDPNQDLEKQ
jgi:hypothetical protein